MGADRTDFSVFGTRDYRRSRGAYHMECAFEYFVTLLVTDSFLATLLTQLGLPESLTGVLSSLVSLAFLFELLSVLVVERIGNTKRFVIIFHFIGQLFFVGLYLLPLLGLSERYRGWITVACILLAYFGRYFVTAILFKWANSYVDPRKRGVYSSVKEMISLLSGAAVTVAAGYVMGRFEASGNVRGWFLLGAAAIFVFSLCDLVCLLCIRNQVRTPEECAEAVPLGTVLRNVMGNRAFLNTVVLSALWQVASYTTVGFLGTYKNALFSAATVQIINAGASLVRFGLSRPLGRYADTHSYARGVRLALVIAACAFGVNMFTAPGTRWIMAVYAVLYAVSIAGIEQNLINISYSYVDSRYFVQATAIKSSIGGLCGFGASVLAGRLLSAIQANGNMLFGIPVYGQQALSAISFLLVIAAILFCRFVVEKQQVMLQ